MQNHPRTRNLETVGHNYWPRALVVWVVVSAAAAIAGPFGTFTHLSFGERLWYWSVIVGVSILVGRALRRTVEDRFAARSPLVVEVISVATTVPILTAVIWLLSPWLVRPTKELVPDPMQLAMFVLAISMAVAAIRQILAVHWASSNDAQAPAEPRLLRRLPDEMRGEILRLSGRDHHVEVATSAGLVPVRIRFADAIGEMDPVEGVCVHRSHWVSRAAISGVEREPGKIFLRLVNGDRVPVSKKYRPSLEQAGII